MVERQVTPRRSVHGRHCLPAPLLGCALGVPSWQQTCCCLKSASERPVLESLALLYHWCHLV